MIGSTDSSVCNTIAAYSQNGRVIRRWREVEVGTLVTVRLHGDAGHPQVQGLVCQQFAQPVNQKLRNCKFPEVERTRDRILYQ